MKTQDHGVGNPEEAIRRRVEAAPALSSFRKRVYLALLEVPPGFVTTYGGLARRIGCVSAQAVGGALRENPFAPEVPCHRVLAADGRIGGFSGCRAGAAIEKKIRLLRAEGVPLDAEGRLLDARLFFAGHASRGGRIWRNRVPSR